MTPEDFEKLLLPMSAELYRRALVILHNAQDAEDAIQDVFAKLWHRRDTLETVDNLPNYLRECVRHHCISLLRSRREEIAAECVIENEPETGCTPLEAIERKSDTWLMQELIARIPPKAGRMLNLHLYAEMKPDEIARVTGESEQNVRATLSRYRKKLVAQFRRHISPNELKEKK